MYYDSIIDEMTLFVQQNWIAFSLALEAHVLQYQASKADQNLHCMIVCEDGAAYASKVHLSCRHITVTLLCPHIKD